MESVPAVMESVLANNCCLSLSRARQVVPRSDEIDHLIPIDSLSLFSTGVSDAGIAYLTTLMSLKHLNIDSRLVTDTSLGHIANLTGLEHLDLFGTNVTEDGTRSLASLTRLKVLEMCGGNITDSAVQHMSTLTCLETLNISQNEGVTGVSILVLRRFSLLRSLNLAGTMVCSESICGLTLLTNLSSLCLSGCRVNAATLRVLEAMPQMMYLTAEPKP